LSTAAITSFNFPQNFMQTDVILGWDIEFTIAQTYTAGTSALTTSDYFPYQWVNQLKLNIQNQFDTVNCSEGGIDAFLFQTIRPRFNNQMLNVMNQNTLASGYSAENNLDTSASYTTASTSVQFTMQLTPAIHFDTYWELDDKGEPTHGVPLRDVWVSPLLMSGTNRVIQPKVKMNPGSASVLDGGPVNIGAGSGTFSGTATLGFTRYGYYQPIGPEDTPLQFNWQYTREATRYTLAGVSKAKIQLPLAGQILSIFARFYDPAANGGLGGAIALSNITQCNLLYGSGQYRFQDNPQRQQRRFVEQRQIRLPKGVIAWDLAYLNGHVTNEYALNTMNTTNILIDLIFTGTLSSSAYVVIGVEALRFVDKL
jgi:hypothetical protein